MAGEKTKRFARLLRTQQQLERGVEWRFAEARAKRLAAEADQEAAAREIEQSQQERGITLSSSFSRAAVLSGFAAERAAEKRLTEKQAKVAECQRVEAEVEAVLKAMRVKTKQWEKLHENAALIDAEEDLQVLQRSWDEHGIRSHNSDATTVSDGVAASVEAGS
jgi:predicted RNase H-like nuclease